MKTFGVLLAGGRSRRFGSEKAVAPFGLGLLMDGPLQALAANCEALAVSAAASSVAAEIAATCDYSILRDNPSLPDGPLRGLLAALEWAAAGGAARLATAPCDAALLDAGQVRMLLAAADAHGGAAAAVSDSGLEPLIAALPVEAALAELRPVLKSGRHPPVRFLLEALSFTPVTGFASGNVNAPDELARLTPATPDAPEHGRLFAFEDDFVRTLRCIPMCIRFKLDRVAIKLSLRQWSRFSLDDRLALRRLPCESAPEQMAFRAALVDLIAARAGEEAKVLAQDPGGDWLAPTPPQGVTALARDRGVAAPTDESWRALSILERYALVKLSRDRHENANFVPALREFGLI